MPRYVVLHGALLEPTGTQMDKPLPKYRPDSCVQRVGAQACSPGCDAPGPVARPLNVVLSAGQVQNIGPRDSRARELTGGPLNRRS